MGLKPRAFLAGSLGFAVAFVVACGSGTGLLSGQQADSLNAQLNAVSAAVSAHRCAGAAGAVRAFSSQVAALPPTVNTTLSRNLSQGADTLGQLAQRDCTTSSSSSSSSSSTTSSTTNSSTSSISTTTVTNSTPPSSSSSSTNAGTATNPGGTGTSSTSSNGGAGIGGTPGGNGQ